MKDLIEIINCSPEHYKYFRELNLEWIKKYFIVEEVDEKVLNDPEKYILKNGGYIFMAMLNNEVVGTCALIKTDNKTYELAKMAVIDKAKGKGIGYLLGQKCIEAAKQAVAEKVFLQSNTILEPAINLYRKLGFQEIKMNLNDYKRSNIVMEMAIK